MPDDISTKVTNKKVKETVEESKETQNKALSAVKELANTTSSLVSGMQSIVTNAQNVISQTITGITGTLEQSITKFSQEINAGLTNTLTDLSKKFGSAISEITGKVNMGAIAGKLSFIADTASAVVNGVSLFGEALAGGVTGLLSSFTNGQLNRLLNASGIAKIWNNSDLGSAINSVVNSVSTITSAAKSIVSDVIALPSKIVSTVTGTINDITGGILSAVKDSVGQLMGTSGIGDVGNIVKDMFDIYSMGREIYDAVTGKDNSIIVGIASKFNNSFPEVQSLLNMASEVCSTLTGKNVENYRKNKDLLDLLLLRMANQGMYGAIQDLMNCTDSQKYVTEDSYKVLASKLASRCSVGDVKTASTIQQIVGNSKISNAEKVVYDLACSMDGTTDNISEFSTMLSNMNISPTALTGKNYSSKSGSTYIYSTSSLNKISNNNPAITDSLLGGNSTIRKMSSALSAIL